MTSNLSNRQILDYIFQKLSDKEDAEISSILDDDQDYNEAVISLGDYFIENNVTYDNAVKTFASVNPENILITHYQNVLKHKSEPRKKSTLTYLSAAAILIACAVVSSLLYFRMERKVTLLSSALISARDSLGSIRQIDSSSHMHTVINQKTEEFRKQSDELRKIAEANLINADLEERRRRFLISRGHDITLLSPSRDQTIKKGQLVQFKWESDVLPNRLLVYNNRGEIIQSIKLSKASLVLQTATLSPGLYYWVLEHMNDDAYIDRIIVKSD